jgi:hypothetical protein
VVGGVAQLDDVDAEAAVPAPELHGCNYVILRTDRNPGIGHAVGRPPGGLIAGSPARDLSLTGLCLLAGYLVTAW